MMSKYVFLLVGLVLFSGCVPLDALTEKKNEITQNIDKTKENMYDQFATVQTKIEEIQANIEEKKVAIDQKLKELEEAKQALNALFGSETDFEKKQLIEQELDKIESSTKILEAEKEQDLQVDELEKEILELQKKLEEMKK